MEYGAYLDDAFTYTKEGILCNMNRWFSLIIALICLGIPLNGYVMRVYRGTTPAPDVDRWGTLFVDGLKLIIVGLIYAIPMMIVLIDSSRRAAGGQPSPPAIQPGPWPRNPSEDDRR